MTKGSFDVYQNNDISLDYQFNKTILIKSTLNKTMFKRWWQTNVYFH